MTNILFEGWRGLPHSYCVWSTSQIAILLNRPGVQIFFRDVPHAKDHWRAVSGLFPRDVEEGVAALAAPPAGLVPDVLVRTAWPYVLDPAPARHIFVQATAEYGVVFDNFIWQNGANTPLARVAWPENLKIVTCSNWSREGFLRSGAARARVAVVPLGVDSTVFHPASPSERAEARQARGFTDEFVFLSIGAMTQNKNPTGIVRAFVEIAQKFPSARLLLKGADALFDSRAEIDRVFGKMSDGLRVAVSAKIRYIGESLTPQQMAALHHCADAYLAPYTAEGFCLPALEAAACGLPVIVTKGGPTDDFTHAGFALAVASRQRWAPDRSYLFLEPAHASIVAQMQRALTDQAFRERARREGPAHAAKFSWTANVDALLALARS